MTNTATLDQQLQAIVQQEGAQIASLTVSIVHGGEMVYQGAFGHRFIDPENPQNNLPANIDTKFRIASISKSVVALAVMQCVEKGLLDLDGDTGAYLGFPLRNPHHPDTPITPRMLLSHTSSLRDGTIYSIPTPPYTMRDFFLPEGEFYREGEHFAEQAPGDYFCYCNLNFGVLGTLIEAVSGQRFDQYMDQHILKPLDIDAGYNIHLLSDAGFANIGVLYMKYDEALDKWDPDGPWMPIVDNYHGQRPENALFRVENPDTGISAALMTLDDLETYEIGANGTIFSPQGGLRISANDLSKIMQLFMHGGTVDGVTLLKPETVAQMLTIQWVYDESQNNGDIYDGVMRAWGLGLHYTTASGGPGNGDKIDPAGRLKLWGHSGNAYGLLSGMWFDPASQSGFVFMLGGMGGNPWNMPRPHSSFLIWEQQIMDAITQTWPA